MAARKYSKPKPQTGSSIARRQYQAAEASQASRTEEPRYNYNLRSNRNRNRNRNYAPSMASSGRRSNRSSDSAYTLGSDIEFRIGDTRSTTSTTSGRRRSQRNRNRNHNQNHNQNEGENEGKQNVMPDVLPALQSDPSQNQNEPSAPQSQAIASPIPPVPQQQNQAPPSPSSPPNQQRERPSVPAPNPQPSQIERRPRGGRRGGRRGLSANQIAYGIRRGQRYPDTYIKDWCLYQQQLKKNTKTILKKFDTINHQNKNFGLVVIYDGRQVGYSYAGDTVFAPIWDFPCNADVKALVKSTIEIALSALIKRHMYNFDRQSYPEGWDDDDENDNDANVDDDEKKNDERKNEIIYGMMGECYAINPEVGIRMENIVAGKMGINNRSGLYAALGNRAPFDTHREDADDNSDRIPAPITVLNPWRGFMINQPSNPGVDLGVIGDDSDDEEDDHEQEEKEEQQNEDTNQENEDDDNQEEDDSLEDIEDVE